jgi:putative SOS response-associated peptidase YedK
MCGRFTLKTPPRQIAEQFNLPPDHPVFSRCRPHYNIAPSQPILVLRQPADSVLFDPGLLQWGLIPSWAKDPKFGRRLINARAETLSSKPSFRKAFESRRCLIVADGYYEWKKTADQKQPFYFFRPDERPFLFAGLWESGTGRAAGYRATLDSCTIIRMPVILGKTASRHWLQPAAKQDMLQALLEPVPEDFLRVKPVSRFVNQAHNDGPACLRPP